jgi:hypothetical protein
VASHAQGIGSISTTEHGTLPSSPALSLRGRHRGALPCPPAFSASSAAKKFVGDPELPAQARSVEPPLSPPVL